MQGLILLVVAIVVISAVVGAIAQFLNKLNEATAQPPRRVKGAGDRQVDRDMDRFLAEIDRLRKKNADNAESTAAKPKPAPLPVPKTLKAKPVSRSNRPEREKKRPPYEMVESPRRRVDTSPMAAPPLPVQPGSLSPDASARPEQLPVATVVGPTSATGAPATRVTRLPQRERPAPKTPMASGLTSLLGSGNGVAMAVILTEVLGRPKSRKG
jgi:hypothetical protein